MNIYSFERSKAILVLLFFYDSLAMQIGSVGSIAVIRAVYENANAIICVHYRKIKYTVSIFGSLTNLIRNKQPRQEVNEASKPGRHAC